jgi:hypothetical protein
MQSTYVDDQHHDTAPLAPEWPSAIDARSRGFENDHLAGRPSIVRRALRSLTRFSIAVLIGAGATLAWQSYGGIARELLSTQVPSLSWLLVSTTTPTLGPERSAQEPAGSQSVPIAQAASPAAAATTSEFTQLEPIAHDLAAMRHSLEQLAAKQEQMAQNIAAMQAAEQDIRKKMLAQTISDQPRKPPKPPANSPPSQSPVRPPPPVVQSPSQ